MSASTHQISQVLQRAPRRIQWQDAKRAAVAAILVHDPAPGLAPGHSPELVLVRRAQFEGDPWSGHVAFPGGRVEPDDATPLAAAIRETREEIGVELQSEWLLGELDELPTIGPLPAMVIQCFVFAAPRRPIYTPNVEVASVHHLPLRDLLRGMGRGPMDLTYEGHSMEFARVDFDNLRLWGLTLRMVDDLLHRLDGRGMGMERI